MKEGRNIVVCEASGPLVGEHNYIEIHKVIFGESADQAVLEGIARLGKSRVFFVFSGTLNQKTEVIEQFGLFERHSKIFVDTRNLQKKRTNTEKSRVAGLSG
jgi:hypothetical protein